jgi:hypothetical protein
MASVSIDGISLNGFSERINIGVLRETRCFGVPPDFGIYLIVRASDCIPEFLPRSTGGRFKKKDPTCPPEFVRKNWVESAHVVYIGKAAGRKGLRRRLYELVAFGYGEAIGHWGGRLLWHLPEREKLLVQWQIWPSADANRAETAAISNFRNVHNDRRPFANLRN